MLSISAPIMAQNANPEFDAIKKVIVDAKGDVESTKGQIKVFMKTNKKNPVAIAALGRAFLDAKNFEQAKVYADMAIKVGKNNAAGYILRGDIASAEDDGGTAASYYEMSTQQAPNEPLAYVKYARVYQKVDDKGAVAMLEKLRTVKPDYPVDAAAGFMYSQNGKLKSAMERYDAVQDPSTVEDYILFDYASTAYVLEEYDKAIRLANIGIQKYPQYSSFNRIALYSSDKTKKYDDAVAYGQKLFSATDTVKYTANDYIYYADALINTGKYDEAVAAYNKIPEIDAENKLYKKYIALAYQKAKRYDEAVAAMEEYIKAQGKDLTSADYESLVDVYVNQALEEGVSESQKVASLEKADQVYVNMADKFPANDNTALYIASKRAGINHTINPDVKAGRALPFYQQIVKIVEPKAEKSRAESKQLTQAYNYIAYYCLLNGKKDEAKSTITKWLALDPENTNAQEMLKSCK